MKYCQECGKKNIDNARFCCFCGKKISGQKRFNTRIIILSTFLIVLLFSVTGHYFFLNSDKEIIHSSGPSKIGSANIQVNTAVISTAIQTSKLCNDFITLTELDISLNNKYVCTYGIALIAEHVFSQEERTYFVIAYGYKTNNYQILRFKADGDYSKKWKNCIAVRGLLETNDGKEFTFRNGTAQIISCTSSQKEDAPSVSDSNLYKHNGTDNSPELYDWDLYFSNE
jgi:hypothetical protein